MAKTKKPKVKDVSRQHPGKSQGFGRDRAFGLARKYGDYERMGHLSWRVAPCASNGAEGEPK